MYYLRKCVVIFGALRHVISVTVVSVFLPEVGANLSASVYNMYKLYIVFFL